MELGCRGRSGWGGRWVVGGEVGLRGLVEEVGRLGGGGGGLLG